MARGAVESRVGNSEPLAIIGFAFEFPSGATDPQSFWQMLVNGKIGLGDIPDDRFNLGAFHETKNSDGRSQRSQGYFIGTDISAFDAPFFSIAAEEALAMDPQQRLLLQTAYHAFENAGLALDHINGSKTSVHVGCLSQDYRVGNLKDTETSPKYAATGDEFTILANRLSWFFNLSGPSMSVETACSSSLVAFDLACQLLRNGDTDMGLVAGTSLIHQPDFYIHLDNMGFLSPDNRCHSFDSRANGYARAEGIGVVLIKRLSDAIKDGDTIRTVVRATGSNSDGHTPGITQPSGASQLRLIRDTYKRAGLSMKETRYCEAHGTGTTIGDPTEAHAIGTAFLAARSSEDPLYIGSVKSNTGHMEAASGIAGIIKTILVLERGVIPPIAGLIKLNPAIDDTFYKLSFPVKAIPWPSQGLRRASVNSFGYGGTNAHVVMDDAHNYLIQHELKANHNTTTLPPQTVGEVTNVANDTPRNETTNAATAASSRPYLLILSTADRDGIERMGNTYNEYLKNSAHPHDLRNNSSLCRRLAFTLDKHRSPLPWKGYTLVDPQQLHTSDSFTKGLSEPIQPYIDPCLAFVFTGQGAQWARMGIQFMRYPVFARSVQASASYLRSFGCSWDLEEELSRDASNSRVNDTDISQPLSAALQIALVDLLERLNIRPAVVIGHSSGEVAAAYCKGALSQKSALRIAYCRGIGGAAEARDPNRNGTMMAVGLGEADILPIIQDLAAKGYQDIYIGCMNSPSSVSVTGDAHQLDILKSILQEKSIFVRKVKVPCAYHSPHMIPIAKKYVQQAGPLEPRSGVRDDLIPMISYVDGRHVSSERLRELDYWMTNLYSPVRFTQSVSGIDQLALLAKSKRQKKLDLSHRGGMLVTNILEIGPHSASRGPLRDIIKTFQHAPKAIKYDTALIRGNTTLEPLLQAMGSLRCSGFNPDILYLNSDDDIQETTPLVDLPSYKFNTSSYWAESRRSKDQRFRRHKPSELLGTPTPDWQPFCGTWRNFLSRSRSTWMEDHKVNEVLIYPGAGMISMAIEAMNQYALDTLHIEPEAFCVMDIEFIAAMQVPEPPSELETHTHLRVLGDTYKPGAWFKFTIFSFRDDLWKLNCRGRIRADVNGRSSNRTSQHNSTQSSAATSNRVDEFYEKVSKAGYQFGPSFQRIRQLRCSPVSAPGKLQGVVDVYDRVGPDSSGKQGLRAMDWTHIIHPTTLDAFLQISLANVAFGKDSTDSLPTMIPTKVKKLWLSSTGLSSPSASSLSVTTWSERSGYEYSVQVTDLRNPDDVKVEISGYEMTVVAGRGNAASTSISPADLHMCWDTTWEALPPISVNSPNTINGKKLKPARRQPIVEIHIANAPSAEATGLATALQLKLKEAGCKGCKIIDGGRAMDVDGLVADLKIILWDVGGEPYCANISEGALTIMKRVLNTRNHVLWVKTSDSPSAHIIDGLSRVLRREQSMSSFATILTTSTSISVRVDAISQVSSTLLSENSDGSDTSQTFRETTSKGIEVCRLRENKEVTEKVQSVQLPPEPDLTLWNRQTSGPLKIAMGPPGELDTIHFIEDPSPEHLHVDEVEVEIKAVGISFKDCIAAAGASGERSIGNEIAGVVTRTGLNVKHLTPGDHVCSFATNGFRTFFRNHAKAFCILPDSLTFSEAASIPLNFATALYTLQHTARLTAGESVLIHRGAGGTGQAAIQAAQYLGAIIFTTAGTSEKRQSIAAEYGIPQDHIFNSRDNDFVAGVQRLTNGRGVDVVLNSLPGEQLAGSWERIAPFGRFVEIGRQAVPADAQSMKNYSFTAVDMADMAREHPVQATKMVSEALSLFEKGIFRPLKIRRFAISEVADALELMRGGKMSGKMVVDIEPSMRVQAMLAPKQKQLFDSAASYIIAGGLGGLGCDIARWMVERGARHLILLSRSGPSSRSAVAQALIADLKDLEVNCVTPACDISSFQSVKETLNTVAGAMPPVKGCIQASMVLRSALFADMTHSEWSEVLAPKVSGSWNLHSLLPKDLDFFILLSSIQGVMGGRTQGNYAAANTYMDALAEFRISQGPKAVSLQLGLMDTDGYLAAAENQEEKRMMLAQNSYVPIQRSEFHALLDHYCDATLTLGLDEARVALGIKLLHINPDLDPLGTSWGRDPIFQELRRLQDRVATKGATGKETVSQLAAARSIEEGSEVVIKALTDRLASIVYANGTDGQNIDRNRPVQAYGVDSLQTMELRSWFLKTFRSDVPTFEILGAQSLNSLALIIAERSTLVHFR